MTRLATVLAVLLTSSQGVAPSPSLSESDFKRSQVLSEAPSRLASKILETVTDTYHVHGKDKKMLVVMRALDVVAEIKVILQRNLHNLEKLAASESVRTNSSEPMSVKYSGPSPVNHDHGTSLASLVTPPTMNSKQKKQNDEVKKLQNVSSLLYPFADNSRHKKVQGCGKFDRTAPFLRPSG